MPESDRKLTRRQFIATAGAAVAAAVAASPSRAQTPADRTPATPGDGSRKPVVAEVRSDDVLVGPVVRPSVLEDMFIWALTTLTLQRTTTGAWRRLIKPGETVGIKFNRVGAEVIGTTPALADLIVRSLNAAGIKPENVVLIEAPRGLAGRLQTTRPAFGWTDRTFDIGKGPEQLAAVVEQVDALISVGSLKTHNLAGFTACMKNVSHGLVRHPARYHDDGCGPFVGRIIAQPPIRKRLRLNIIDALRVVYAGGPEAVEANLQPAGSLLMGTDPVATDTVGLELLNQIRTDLSLPMVGGPAQTVPYLQTAAALALGVPHLEAITHELKRF